MPNLAPHSFASTSDVLPAYEDVAAPPIRVSIAKKIYTIPPMPVDMAIALSKAFAGVAEVMEEYKDTEKFYRAVLGDLYDELLADRVPHEAVDRILLVAVTDYSHGRIQAEGIWALGPDPEMHRAYVEATGRIYAAAQVEAAKNTDEQDPDADVETEAG